MISGPLTENDYQVGWICALPIEAAAATALLDEEHPPLDQDARDTNAYTLGRIGRHNVVIGCLPLGTVGESPATAVAKDMLRSFPNIKTGLMVGIGGGAPGPPNDNPEEDIRLGDIVVSKPGPGHGGVIQYDYGKTLSEGEFMNIGYLNRPPNVLLSALTKLVSRHELEGSSVLRHLEEMRSKYPRRAQNWQYQGAENDQLYVEDFPHVDISHSCKELGCAVNNGQLVARNPRATDDPVIHCGLIASGNQVMRDGITREKLRKKHGVLCFEMEAAGLNNNFPCLVIRGICDYSDSHKSKQWQPYAAAVSAAFAKELLQIIPAAQLDRAERVEFITGKMDREFGQLNDNIMPLLRTQEREERQRILNWLSPGYYLSQHADAQQAMGQGSSSTFMEDPQFIAWLGGSYTVRSLFCPGLPGAGKTTMASLVIDRLCRSREKMNSTIAFVYFNFNLHAEQTTVNVLRSVLRQLVEALSSIPDWITERYHAGQPVCLNETAQLLHRAIELSSQQFVVIDALDECSFGCFHELIPVIRQLQRMGVRFMLTSRHIDAIEKEFRDMPNCHWLEVRAVEKDMGAFIDRNFDFSSFYRTPDELPEIDHFKRTIIDAAHGMFILVRLYLNILKRKCTRGEIQEELNNVANGRSKDPIQEAYHKTLLMIEKAGHSDWAFRVISWVFHARRRLSPMELREALAAQTQRDGTHLDLNYAPPDVTTVISYCSGIVSLSPSTGFIEFVHFTAYQYFERYHHQHSWISSGREMSLTCLRYLSFDLFAPETDRAFFLDYAVRFWAEHTKSVQNDQKVRQYAMRFLQTPSLTAAADRMFPIDDPSYITLSLADDLDGPGAAGIHLAARFGLATQVRDLLDVIPVAEINGQDSCGQTPLLLAVKSGCQDVVDLLLENPNIAPDIPDIHGWSPLSIAARLGLTGVTKSLLSTGKVDPNLPAWNGWTPTMYAARSNRLEILELLLEVNSADPTRMSPDGDTALTLAVEMGYAEVVGLLLKRGGVGANPSDLSTKRALEIALGNGNKDVMHTLLQNGFEQALEWLTLPQTAVSQNVSPLLMKGSSALDVSQVLLLAVQNGLTDVVSILLRNNVDINRVDYGGKSMLMVAVENRQKEVVEILLRASSCTDTMTKSGDTALFLAVVRGDADIVRILLKIGGANPNAGCNDPYKYPLPLAVENHHEEMIELLLKTSNINPNPGLQAAITTRQMPMIRMFLKLPNVDPNVQDRPTGQTILMTAIRLQDLEMVRWLLEKNMADVNARNSAGETALMRAVTMYDLETVRLLVEVYGADITARTNYGATALDWAERYRWTIDEVIRLLSPKRVRLS